MIRRLHYIIIGLVVCLACTPGKAQQAFYVMEYNVENYFDCRHDSLKNDYEYLPGALRGWSNKRYADKRDKIAKVILAAARGGVPDVVALCEVENAACMDALIKYSPLRDAAYRYVMTDSPDERGIDVALLYQPSSFRLIHSESLSVPPLSKSCRPTRDILHVAGRLVSGDTLDVFVCHLPSRMGGERQTRPYRQHAVRILRHAADSVMQVRKNPYIVITGDFNAEPSSPLVRETLGAKNASAVVESHSLYELMKESTIGTYRYKGEWSIIDHLIVNGSLLQGEKNAISVSSDGVGILAFPFLLEDDGQYGGEKPFRTYHGMKYQGGFSDHLPILLKLLIKE